MMVVIDEITSRRILMIELPEALVIANQMNEAIRGRQIASAMRGNAPHKFAFYTRSAEEYAALLPGKVIGPARGHGGLILIEAEPDYLLALGGGGERIALHRAAKTLPKKHQLLLGFTDGGYLTVTVQGWGAAMLFHDSEVPGHPWVGKPGVSPLSDAFSYEFFQERFGELKENDSSSVKFFMISKPGVWGVGNGCLQDILFRARLHPRRRALDLSEAERRSLYTATRETLRQMVSLGGRDGEIDLFGQPGGYRRILSSETAGQPCPECGEVIEKIQYLGGASYFCPKCQA
jgi:formamidopyrimidine-DNA glycosylase